MRGLSCFPILFFYAYPAGLLPGGDDHLLATLVAVSDRIEMLPAAFVARLVVAIPVFRKSFAALPIADPAHDLHAVLHPARVYLTDCRDETYNSLQLKGFRFLLRKARLAIGARGTMTGTAMRSSG